MFRIRINDPATFELGTWNETDFANLDWHAYTCSEMFDNEKSAREWLYFAKQS